MTLLSSAFVGASETIIWDGTCRNVTMNMDGYLKLYAIEDGSNITGFISISGWLYGSGDIRGKRDGNNIRFTSTGAGGIQIKWEGLVRGDVLDGEYQVDPLRELGMEKQVGEFRVSAVDKGKSESIESEASFRKLFMLVLETELNAPVTQADGTAAFGADVIFHAVHPAGEGVSIKVTDVSIDWKDGASRKDAKDIRKYTIEYTLYWRGVITASGWTKMRLSYNANLAQVTEHTILQTTGTTKQDVTDVAFGIGVLIGNAAIKAVLESR